MKQFIIKYVILTLIIQVSSVKLSFINNYKHFNGYYINPISHNYKINPSNDKFKLNSIIRNGVCVPQDVGLFGRMMVSYECLYTKDGRTQTGDEWEDEMREHTKRNFPGKTKKVKKIKKLDTDINDPDSGFVRFELPAPFDTTKMLLREGIPYLRVSLWIPGIKKDEIKVFLNYTKDQKYPDSYLENVSEIPNSNELNTYYETCESEPVEEQHKYSYNSTYNDLFNRIKQPEYGYADTTDDILKPPLLMINFPKNTIVNQWENVTFSSKRNPMNKKQLSRVQRAYRPFSHVDLRNISCIYKDSALQLLFKLTHITPPPEFQKNYSLSISEEGEIKPPKVLPKETVHGWMYNWHFFNKYDLKFDLSKFELPEDKPKFVNDMTPRQVRDFIREADKYNKKD